MQPFVVSPYNDIREILLGHVVGLLVSKTESNIYCVQTSVS